MTGSDLQQTMRTATDDLHPAAPEELLSRALVAGDRRRTRRRVGVGVASVAALGLAATGIMAFAGLPGSRSAQVGVAGQTTAQPTVSDTHTAPLDPIAEGPSVPTQRRLVGDDALKAAVRDLLAPASAQELSVEHVVGSGVGGHMDDTTTDGRLIGFKVNGAAASIGVGRWDGYHAVGTTQTEPAEPLVATTAEQACSGAFQQAPANVCTSTPDGWYTVGHPSAGGAAGSKELWVDLFTEDGFVIRVHTLNTAAEKQGDPVQDDTALTEAQSLELARSGAWFTQK